MAVLAGLVVFFSMAGGVFGQGLELAGGWSYGPSEAAAFDDNKILFLGDGAGVLFVDASNPETLRINARLPMAGVVKGLFYEAPYLYVADGGLMVINTLNKEQNYLTTPGKALDVFVLENVAYIADGDQGVYMVDVSDPLNPSHIGTIETVDAHAVFAEIRSDSEDQVRAYIADGTDGLKIMDVTTPETPGDLGNSDIPENALDVVVEGDIAYIADGDAGLKILNIADLGSINEMDAPSDFGPALNLHLNGANIYVSKGDAGFAIVDKMTSEVVNVETQGTVFQVVKNDDYAYVANGESGLAVFNVSDPQSQVSQLPLDTSDIAVSGDFVYMTDGANALHILNAANPAAPTYTGRFDLAGQGRAVAIDGNSAYVIDGPNNLISINITDPNVPESIGDAFTGLNDGKDVFVIGDYAYVADGAGGLKAIDVATNPATPALSGEWDTEGVALGVVVVGDYAYLANGPAGLFIANITQPDLPQETYGLSIQGGAVALAVSGNYAYIAKDEGGVAVVDISDFSTMSVIKVIAENNKAADIIVAGDFLYVCLASGAVQIYSIGQPDDPKEVVGYTMNGPANAIAFFNNYVFVAGGDRGLEVLNFTPPETPDLPSVPDATEIEKGSTWFIAKWDEVLEASNYELDVAYDSDFTDYVDGYQAKQVSGNTATVADLAPDTVYYYRVRVVVSGLTSDSSSIVAIHTEAEFLPVASWANASFNTIALNTDDPDGPFLFMGSGTEIFVFNAADPAAPVKLNQMPTPGNVRDLLYQDGYLYVADGGEGLRIKDLNQFWAPEVGVFPPDGGQHNVQSVFLSDDFDFDIAFIAGGVNDGIALVNIEDRESPQFFAKSSPLVDISDVVYNPNKDLIFATDSFGFHIFRMFSDGLLGLLGSVDIPGAALAVHSTSEYAYVAGSKGLYVIDFDDPSEPIIIASHETPKNVEAIYVSGGYAYFLDGSAFYIWKNADSPEEEKRISSYDLSGFAHDFELWGHYIFIADGDGGLKVLKYNYELMPPQLFLEPVHVEDEWFEAEWKPVPGAEGYRVEMAKDAQFNNILASIETTSLWERFDGLTPGTTYYVRVFAQMSGAESAPSEVMEVRIHYPGDLDGNGAVNLADAIVALKTLAGIPQAESGLIADYGEAGADIDGNNQVGIAEVVFVLREVAEASQ